MLRMAIAATSNMTGLTTANALTSVNGLKLTHISDVHADADNVSGNFLKWSGSEWVADTTVLTTTSSIESLGDVGSFVPGDGEVLTWTTTGTDRWIAAAVGSASATNQLISGANADVCYR